MLTLLCFNSSEDQFEEYTRRQYLAKKPSANPFGDDEKPKPFLELDFITKVVLGKPRSFGRSLI